MRPASKIALGTAQFGLPYGIANSSGQLSIDEVKRTLNCAREFGVDTLDTAMLYGESERVLGLQDLHNLSVITKLGEVPDGQTNLHEWVRDRVDESLDRLGLQALDGLLLHRPGQLLEPFGPALFDALKNIRRRGRVRRIGVSIYSPIELESLCSRYHFDLVQAPFNVLDRRLYMSGWMQRLEEMGTAIHVRSVFMQGLLLMTKNQRPEKFSRWGALWERWGQWLADNNQSALNACLGFAMSFPQIERVVVGVDSTEQLRTILNGEKASALLPPESLSSEDADLLNPSCWSQL